MKFKDWVSCLIPIYSIFYCFKVIDSIKTLNDYLITRYIGLRCVLSVLSTTAFLVYTALLINKYV